MSSSGRRWENGGWLKYVSLICTCKYHSGLWHKKEWNVLQQSQNRHCSSYKKECIFNEILIMVLCDIRVCILQPPALSQSVGLPQNPKAWACRRLLFAERHSDDFSWCEETFLANSFLGYPSALSSSLRWRVKVVG